ncbi:hypothetical protein EAG_16274 [Camponotus floridanus]|uniref:Uncharacterized protein n=1 Tax=Camponotus floridanus TaxID=104421 RepID=E2AGA1_CAMFO|nr:hypothetical protein EAG_16274 [Camponotus floridanus]
MTSCILLVDEKKKKAIVDLEQTIEGQVFSRPSTKKTMGIYCINEKCETPVIEYSAVGSIAFHYFYDWVKAKSYPGRGSWTNSSFTPASEMVLNLQVQRRVRERLYTSLHCILPSYHPRSTLLLQDPQCLLRRNFVTTVTRCGTAMLRIYGGVANFCVRAAVIVGYAVEFTLLTRLRYGTFPGSDSYLAMSKVKEGEVARDPASIEDVQIKFSLSHRYELINTLQTKFVFPTWRSFHGIVELERERGRERSWWRRSREARERERQATSIRREFTLSAALLQRYGAGNSENVVPGPPGADRRSAGRVPEREEVPRPGGGDGGGAGDVRLGGVRAGERKKDRTTRETTSEKDAESGWKKREQEGGRERETWTNQKESRCKLGLSGSRLQLEDKSFPRDSCALGSGTRDIQVGLDGGGRWLRELEGISDVMGLLGTHLYLITSATVSPRAAEPGTGIFSESPYFDLKDSWIDDAKSFRIVIAVYRNSESLGENTVETPELFRIPTVNHSYRVDGAMCMITPCLLAAINLHPFAPPHILGFYRYPKDLCLRGLRNGRDVWSAGKWCPRREWSSPPDAQRAASDARRGVLYSSVFLGSPGRNTQCKAARNDIHDA